MKRLMIILLSILSLTSCDLTLYDRTYIVGDDAFRKDKVILSREEMNDSTVIRFPVITDVHCGRELFDNGVERNYESLRLYLEDMARAGDVTPLFMLGDILDKEDRNAIEETKQFFRDVHEANPDMEIVYTCGNHELEDCMVEDWEARFEQLSHDELNEKLNLTGSYVVGNPENPELMIYNVNSAYRMYGRHQLSMLEDALSANMDRNGGLKLITTHIPLSASKVSQTLFNFVIGDERERHAMQRLMHEYGPSFMLSGHHHKGDTFNPYSGHSAEFIFSAFHKKGEFLESQGRWYIFQIDVDSRECNIWGFSIWDENLEPYGRSDAELTSLAAEHYTYTLDK